MIVWIEGKLAEIEEDNVIIQTQGLGYHVYFPTLHRTKLPPIGESIKLYTYHHIREDTEQLYGFLSPSDKSIFIQLTSVNGVGPKLALKICSSIESSNLAQLIHQKDSTSLTRLPGVGKKMAERMIIDLSDKLSHLIHPSDIKEITHNFPIISNELTNDISLALRSLGYNTSEVKQALKKSSSEFNENTSIEQGIKITLKHL